VVRETAWHGFVGHDGGVGEAVWPISMIRAPAEAGTSAASTTAASASSAPFWVARIPPLNTTTRPGLRPVR
jgi:hypothetical protein